MIDMKSFLLGGAIVLVGVYWAIKQQKPAPERQEVIVFKKKASEPEFSAN